MECRPAVVAGKTLLSKSLLCYQRAPVGCLIHLPALNRAPRAARRQVPVCTCSSVRQDSQLML